MTTHIQQQQQQQHIVIPGQIIATSTESDHDGGFLRGHGTYIETKALPKNNNNNKTNRIDDGIDHNPISTAHTTTNDDDDENPETNNSHTTTTTHSTLIASTTGTIERTNRLLTIQPLNTPYNPQPGDPIIGRVTSITSNAWKVSTTATPQCGKLATLPLTGIFLEDGMQRIRTSADALRMRGVLGEGDLVSAEVRGGGGGGSGGRVTLHARSMRCGKLENGCVVFVPGWLVGRRKKNFMVLGKKRSGGSSGSSAGVEDGFEGVKVEVLLGCNGGIWIQRALTALENLGTETPNPEVVQSIRNDHARTGMLLVERRVVARVRNAVEALKLVRCRITPENIEGVVKASAVTIGVEVKDMLKPDVVVRITQCTRTNNHR